MNRKVGTVCPYCEHGNLILVEDDYSQKTVATCDDEDGGCGKDFVVAVNVSISVKEFKIEGEEGQR